MAVHLLAGWVLLRLQRIALALICLPPCLNSCAGTTRQSTSPVSGQLWSWLAGGSECDPAVHGATLASCSTMTNEIATRALPSPRAGAVLLQLADACGSYLPAAAREALLAEAGRQPSHAAVQSDSQEELDREMRRNPLEAAAHEASEM